MRAMRASQPTAPGRTPARAGEGWGVQPLLLAAALAFASAAAGCEACSASPRNASGGADAGAGSGLSPEQAAQVLARVGQRSITLGDYAAALERMDPFERMRYQTKDRRLALLEEMINVELLAREAERRGLDRRPETIELVRQFQRDELLQRLRQSLPHPEQLSVADVSAYYERHRAEFFEPERRRGAEIALTDESLARRVLAEAQGSSPERWRELVLKYAPEASPVLGDKTSARPPLQVAGDLGMLSRGGADDPGDVGEPVRKALFEISEPGQVHPALVAHAGRFHILRLVSRVEARQRLLAEVDSLIRTRLVQELQESAEAALIARLRRSTQVSIDETELGQLLPPESAASGSASTPGSGSAPAAPIPASPGPSVPAP
jgi:peptidyl-prolyl cis-trans isomerase C